MYAIRSYYDQRGVFGNRDELHGWNETAVGALPSEEGFDANQLPGVQVDLGLECGEQLSALV